MTRFSRLIESIGQQRDKVIEYQTRMTELPALGPENAGTGEMPKALYLEGLLRELGVTDILRIDAPDPRVPDGVRPNVVARIPRRVAASALDSGAYGRCASGRAFLLED